MADFSTCIQYSLDIMEIKHSLKKEQLEALQNIFSLIDTPCVSLVLGRKAGSQQYGGPRIFPRLLRSNSQGVSSDAGSQKSASSARGVPNDLVYETEDHSIVKANFRSKLLRQILSSVHQKTMAWKVEWDKTTLCISIAGVTLLAVRRAVLYFRTRCPSRVLMVGKTVVITGANCGIGYQTALDLAYRKARVILACRDLGKAESAACRIRKLTGNQDIVIKKLDLASLKSVRDFCDDINKTESNIDVLINNAGVMKCPYALTEDGFETHVAVNHMGNFLLTNMLKDNLSQAPGGGRVVFVSSSLHRYGMVNLEDLNSETRYKTGKPYNDTKLMNLLFARELHKRASKDGRLCVNSVHPGMVRTLLGRHAFIFNKYFKIFCFPLFAIFYLPYLLLVKTAKEGCQTVVYCAVAPELSGASDGYYGSFEKELWSGPSCDTEMAQKVWNLSAKLTRLEDNNM